MQELEKMKATLKGFEEEEAKLKEMQVRLPCGCKFGERLQKMVD